jgi:hypothetical protein
VLNAPVNLILLNDHHNNVSTNYEAPEHSLILLHLSQIETDLFIREPSSQHPEYISTFMNT